MGAGEEQARGRGARVRHGLCTVLLQRGRGFVWLFRGVVLYSRTYHVWVDFPGPPNDLWCVTVTFYTTNLVTNNFFVRGQRYGGEVYQGGLAWSGFRLRTNRGTPIFQRLVGRIGG